jgi:hypothetical protein
VSGSGTATLRTGGKVGEPLFSANQDPQEEHPRKWIKISSAENGGELIFSVNEPDGGA